MDFININILSGDTYEFRLKKFLSALYLDDVLLIFNHNDNVSELVSFLNCHYPDPFTSHLKIRGISIAIYRDKYSTKQYSISNVYHKCIYIYIENLLSPDLMLILLTMHLRTLN